jgi:hypothetical protein
MVERKSSLKLALNKVMSEAEANCRSRNVIRKKEKEHCNIKIHASRSFSVLQICNESTEI